MGSRTGITQLALISLNVLIREDCSLPILPLPLPRLLLLLRCRTAFSSALSPNWTVDGKPVCQWEEGGEEEEEEEEGRRGVYQVSYFTGHQRTDNHAHTIASTHTRVPPGSLITIISG